MTLRLRRGNTVKTKPGEIANLLLKFNLKLGGINWTLDMSQFNMIKGKNTMFLGADVLHPPPGAMENAPSVGCLVASTSRFPAQFPGIVQLQHNPNKTKKAMEIITHLDNMIVTRLELWQKQNRGQLPDVLVMYRDGVSDQQLQQLLDSEVPLMEKAVKVVYGNAGRPFPKLLWQVCQKRHIVRFCQPKNDRSGAFDQEGNPFPGLVVDQHVVSQTMDDFYLTSHKCIQGTSKPAHHIRLYDETQSDPDDLHFLTHAMSYVFGRSLTSTSIPAPTKLADLLCARTKYRLHEVYFPPPGPKQTYRVENHFKGQEDVHPDIRDTPLMRLHDQGGWRTSFSWPAFCTI